MYENKVWIFDDIINLEDQEKIKAELCGKGKAFPWFFINDVTGGKNPKQSRPAHQHILVERTKDNSNFHSWLLPIVEKSVDKINFKYKRIEQARAFLQLPLNLQNKNVDTPHTDLEYKHLVVLYYVSTTDGDTLIYNEQEIPENLKFTINKRVTPKQGRVVIFDGRFWHTAEQPTKGVRCILNYNLT